MTKKQFKANSKFEVLKDKYFTLIEDEYYQYRYDFGYLHKIDSYVEEHATGEVIEESIQASYLCSIYKTYFEVYYTFFGIDLSKKIFYKDCTVVE